MVLVVVVVVKVEEVHEQHGARDGAQQLVTRCTFREQSSGTRRSDS
jgi:hypothetical protein